MHTTDTVGARERDEVAIRALEKDYDTAWNTGDAQVRAHVFATAPSR
ncbi:MAG TPA: hypothetical protein VIK50_02340 [Gemmatimonadaceae bacterium]